MDLEQIEWDLLGGLRGKSSRVSPSGTVKSYLPPNAVSPGFKGPSAGPAPASSVVTLVTRHCAFTASADAFMPSSLSSPPSDVTREATTLVSTGRPSSELNFQEYTRSLESGIGLPVTASVRKAMVMEVSQTYWSNIVALLSAYKT